jgi:Nup85 Nucleoporin
MKELLQHHDSVVCEFLEPTPFDSLDVTDASHPPALRVFMLLTSYSAAVSSRESHSRWKRIARLVLRDFLGETDNSDEASAWIDLLRVMCGVDEALVQFTNSWFELLIAKLLFQRPFATQVTPKHYNWFRAFH